jgi:hypothetical protein
MTKKTFQITNTRYIWTIEKMLSFVSEKKLKESSFRMLANIAFSHGTRDCETYKTEVLNQNVHEIKAGVVKPDVNGIIKFLLGDDINEPKVFNMNSVKVENEFQKDFVHQHPQKIIYRLLIAESVFLPKLLKPTKEIYDSLDPKEHTKRTFEVFVKEKNTENFQIHYVGYYYTKYYLKGFFFGLLWYLDRDSVTGFYNYGQGFYCFYKGIQNNMLEFDICTDSDDIDEESKDYNIEFDNAHLLV